MSSLTRHAGAREDDVQLRAALQGILTQHFGVPSRITALERRASPQRSSFALEELDVGLDDGSTLSLIFKDVSRGALVRGGSWSKPAFLYAPRREIETYRGILSHAALGTAICYGASVKPSIGRYWLFLERVPGLELYQVGIGTWLCVARWLAAMHARFAVPAEDAEWQHAAPLVRYDARYYRRWLRRARAFTRGAQRAGVRSAMDWLARRYERVVECLLALPATFIHGEFYAANVLVHETGERLRVCPIDWETAAVGPGLIDVAAFTAGTWSEREREALALSYLGALPAQDDRPPAPEVFLAALDCCRLHLAVQWLGWVASPAQGPHAGQDWLGEAVRLAEQLGL